MKSSSAQPATGYRLPTTALATDHRIKMPFNDLREFITALEKRGELKRIRAEVDAELEITEITDRVSKQVGPALLFENVRGSSMPVLINAFGSRERMKIALGITDYDDIA